MKKLEKLKEFIGKSLKYNLDEEVYIFKSYKQEAEKVIIETDKDPLTTTIYDLGVFLGQFEEISTDLTIKPVTFIAQIPTLQTIDNNKAIKLTDILMDNIERVRENKDYVDQAKVVSSNVQTLINLAKLEIEIKTKLG